MKCDAYSFFLRSQLLAKKTRVGANDGAKVEWWWVDMNFSLKPSTGEWTLLFHLKVLSTKTQKKEDEF